MVTTVTKMEIRSEMTEVILNITLEIIHLITGEDYTVVKKKSGGYDTSSTYSNLSRGCSRAQKLIMEEPPPQSVLHEMNKNQKILELASNIIKLLSGEVPIRCQDVTVHFSMEEWEYLEGHKDLYKGIMMENHQNLTPAGCLCDKPSSHEQVSCLSSQSNHFSLSQLGNELKKTTKNVTVCDGGSLKDTSNYTPTNRAQYPSTHIVEEASSCNGETITDPNTPTAGKQCSSPHVTEEAVSCDEEILTEPDINTLSGPIQHDPLLCIKDEPVSCDEEILTEPDIDTPSDPMQHHPLLCIKDEPVSCDEDLSEASIYTSIDHLQYPSHDIKEEPMSSDEELKKPNIYTPTEHLQYPSYIKEEPVSYDDRHSPTNYVQQHQYTYIKIEPNSDTEGNITHPDIYTPIDHAQYSSTHVKEESVSCDIRSVTYPDIYTPTNCIQQQLTTHIKEEPVLSNETDSTDPKRYHTQYSFTHIKEEPVSCRGNAKYALAQPQKDPIARQLEYCKETALYTTIDHTKNFPSACVKDEIDVNHSPTLGCADVRTEKSSSPVKVIVLAHLVDIHPTKPGITNNKHYNSQNEECIASTSNRIKYDIKETRLPFRNRSSLAKIPVAGQTFGDISNLTKYSRIHSKKKTLQCSECGQYFLRKLQLEAHIRMHAKQKSFQCSDCGKYFLVNVELLDRKRNPGETNYTCPVCRKRLDNEPNYLNHEKNHKVEKPYQCLECSKCFSIYYELFIHKKTHMEDSKK